MKESGAFYTVRGYQILNSENKLLTPAMEDYLEMIYRTCKGDDFIRVKQLADRLNVRPSSVTKIVQRLHKLGLVYYQRYGMIRLTVEGRTIGDFLLRRHRIVEQLLKNLGVEESLLKDTELIEHDISLSALKAMYAFNSFWSERPSLKADYLNYRLKLKDDWI